MPVDAGGAQSRRKAELWRSGASRKPENSV